MSMSAESLATAQRLKDAGNELLNAGDYEEALQKYSEGLSHLPLAALPTTSSEQLRRLRVPLLLNAVLCDLKMNPEDQTRRLTLSEQRIAEVLQLEPGNVKAIFRQAQLFGRAGEYAEAAAIVERLCRQHPSERSFRTELASLKERTRVSKRETAAFWSTAVKKTLTAEPEDLEGHRQLNVHSGQCATLESAVLRWFGKPDSGLLLWLCHMWTRLWDALCRRQLDRDKERADDHIL